LADRWTLPAEEAQRFRTQGIAWLFFEPLGIRQERTLGIVLQPIGLGLRIEPASLTDAQVEVLVG